MLGHRSSLIIKLVALAVMVAALVAMSSCAWNVQIGMGHWVTLPDSSKKCVEGPPFECVIGSVKTSGTVGASR